MYRKGLLAIILLLSFNSAARSSADTYAAVMTVTFAEVEIRLANTERWLPLSFGAQAPLGAGDSLRTNRNGRVYLTFGDGVELLVMPNSTFELVEFDMQTGYVLSAVLTDGQVIQRIARDASIQHYRLETPYFTLIDPGAQAGVWARSGQPGYLISAGGELRLTRGDSESTVTTGEGLRITAEGVQDRLEFSPPWNAPRLEGLLDGCAGLVRTLRGDNLNIRVAPNTGDTLLGSIDDVTPVKIMGVTEYTDWYRIQVLSVFAWVEAPAVQADCPDAPILPYLSIERNNSILAAVPVEIDLLEPFYGLPADDSLFYLNLKEG